LERRYKFGKKFSEVIGVANDAQETAQEAQDTAENLDKKLTSEEIFNRLTNNGTLQGLYRDEDTGDLYINAKDIRAGVIKSVDGESTVIDLDSGLVDLTGRIKTEVEYKNGAENVSELSPGFLTLDRKFSTRSESNTISSNGMYAQDNKHNIAVEIRPDDDLVPGSVIDMNYTGVDDTSVFQGVANEDEASLFLNNNGNYLYLLANANRSYISGLTAPVDASDAVNKAYVDGSTAPAGFGLGKDIGELPTANDANNCVKNGWYKLIIGTANGIGSQGIMRVDAEGGANIVQTAYAGYATSKGMVIMQRVKFQGTWGEWEYVTPLCVPGIEYRTTERMGGSPVYCKVISFGTLPNNTFKNVAHGITGKTQNVRYEISTLSTNRMFTHYPGITDVVVDGTNVKITTNQNLSDISVTFLLWYIK
jgi:hypothetical protein